ncbi:MAG: ABC transporter permease [Chloroflexi bacterium]|nr:ABC transporter permease [Chloroflexota bacterium]
MSNLPFLRIAPTKGYIRLNIGELWEFRELLYFLVWRDIKVRYKQTILGVLWAILQPFTTMVVFSLFFGNLAQIPSDGIPYPIFSFVALVPWVFFANGLNNSANSLVQNANMIKKIYFPRLLIPTASSLAGVLDLVLALLVLFGMMAAYGIFPTIRVIFLPLFFVLALVTALGVGFWLSAMNLQFRDIKYVMSFLTQLWLFATPVAYPASLIKNPTVRLLYGLNPMTGVVEGFRWSLLDIGNSPDALLIVSAGVSLFLFVSGIAYFRRLEKTFADVA